MAGDLQEALHEPEVRRDEISAHTLLGRSPWSLATPDRTAFRHVAGCGIGVAGVTDGRRSANNWGGDGGSAVPVGGWQAMVSARGRQGQMSARSLKDAGAGWLLPCLCAQDFKRGSNLLCPGHFFDGV